MIRKAFASGKFYPSDEKKLYDMVDSFLAGGAEKPSEAGAVIVPHAGYVFSGKTAGMTYASVKIPDTLVILCPNHTGLGKAVAVMNEGIWKVPGAELSVNSELANMILDKSSLACADWKAHSAEHSIEVQLPFIFRKNPSATIVPIALMGKADFDILSDLSSAIVSALQDYWQRTMIIASNDMSHFISEKDAKYYDNMAIEQIKNMDARGLLNTVKRENISMCGALASAVALEAAKKRGSRQARLIHYSSSADATGNSCEVVGYAGIRII